MDHLIILNIKVCQISYGFKMVDKDDVSYKCDVYSDHADFVKPRFLTTPPIPTPSIMCFNPPQTSLKEDLVRRKVFSEKSQMQTKVARFINA